MPQKNIHILFSDLLTLLFTLIPGVATLFTCYEFSLLLTNVFVKIMLVSLCLPLIFSVICLALRLATPRMKPGVFAIGFNRGFIAWWCHSLLTRSVRIFGFHYLIFSFAFFRFFYLRCMGAKVPLSLHTSFRVTFHDHPVVEIGPSCIFGEDVEVSGHLITGDRIFIGRVKIGSDVFVGRDTYIGPRTTIASGTVVGPNLNLVRKTLVNEVADRSTNA